MWITRRLAAAVDRLLERIPIVKSIYGSMRDILGFISRKGSSAGFRQVVAVSVTDQIRLVGFVTVEDGAAAPLASTSSDALVGVYLPMSYQIGGYTVYLPRARIEPLDMTIEDAMRFTLTGGLSDRPRPGRSAHRPTPDAGASVKGTELSVPVDAELRARCAGDFASSQPILGELVDHVPGSLVLYEVGGVCNFHEHLLCRRETVPRVAPFFVVIVLAQHHQRRRRDTRRV